MKVCVFDLETSIAPGPHGPAAKNPENDFYTVIYGDHPDRIKVVHQEHGFKRILGVRDNTYMLNNTLGIVGDHLIVGHNLPFDLSYIVDYIREYKWIPECWDTQLAEYLMSGQRHSYASLAELQEIYLGEKVKDDRISKLYKSGIGADKIIAARDRCPRIWKTYCEYCQKDGSTTLQVFYKQYQRAKEMGMLNVIKMYNYYMVSLVVCMNTGIYVDILNTEKTLREFNIKYTELLQKVSRMLETYWTDSRLPPFNVNSPAHKSAVLFGGSIRCKYKVDNGFTKKGKLKTKTVLEDVYVGGLGLPVNLTSESKVDGRYKTGDEVVQKVYTESDNQEAIAYCEAQKKAMAVKKMASTYLEPFLTLSIGGKLYPNFNNTATITSRLSSSAPNMQNIPSKGEYVHKIQGQLIAPAKWLCVAIDYSQLEIYISAWKTKDPKLIKDLLSGVDFHVKRLAYAEDMCYNYVYRLCKIEKIPEWAEKRGEAKEVSYKKQYGAGIDSLAASTGMAKERIKKIFDKEDEEYPGIKLFTQQVQASINSNQRISYEINVPKSKRGRSDKKEGTKRLFIKGIERLPVKYGEDVKFDMSPRMVGYYQEGWGKRYSFEEVASFKYNKILRGYKYTQISNYWCQGGAGDVMAAISCELLPLLLKNQGCLQMVNQVHDSIWFYIKEEVVHKAIPKIVEIMEDVPKAMKKWLRVDVPFKFKVDVKTGQNFGDMKEYEL